MVKKNCEENFRPKLFKIVFRGFICSYEGGIDYGKTAESDSDAELMIRKILRFIRLLSMIKTLPFLCCNLGVKSTANCGTWVDEG